MTNQTADSELPVVTPGMSNQDVSAESGQQNSPDVEALVSKLLEHPLFTKAVEEMAERKAQSTKDRRFSKMETEQGSFKEQLAKLKELQEEGWSEKQALRFMETEQPLAKTEPGTPERKADTQPKAASTDTMALLLGQLELDANDPKVIEAMRVNSDELTKMSALITVAADKRARKNQPANPAAVAVPTGGNVTTNRQELTTKLQELLKNPSKNEKEIDETKAKLKEALAKSV